MKRELIETLQAAYALALAEAKTAQTAAEGIRQVLRDAHGFAEAGAGVQKPAASAAAGADCAGVGGPQVAAMERRAAKEAGRKAKVVAIGKRCHYCGKGYLAKRKDQTNCLSDACRKAAAVSWKNNWAETGAAKTAPKAAAAPATPETGIDPAGSPTRLERIKALAGGGEVDNG